jgi:hypothetical protein
VKPGREQERRRGVGPAGVDAVEDGADVVEGVVVPARLAVALGEVGEGRVGTGEEATPAGEEVHEGSEIEVEHWTGADHGRAGQPGRATLW